MVDFGGWLTVEQTKGGKREGAGRKPSLNPATKLVTFKATPAEHKLWLELGGSRWVKRKMREEDQKPTIPQ